MFTHSIHTSTSKLPFTSRPAWISTQQECPALVKTLDHLRQCTCPSKKQSELNDVKRYLSSVTLGNDSLLVVKGIDPLYTIPESVVVPCGILHKLLTALHLKLGHPTAHQFKNVEKRYFFSINIDDAINHISFSCHPRQSLKTTPAVICNDLDPCYNSIRNNPKLLLQHSTVDIGCVTYFNNN